MKQLQKFIWRVCLRIQISLHLQLHIPQFLINQTIFCATKNCVSRFGRQKDLINDEIKHMEVRIWRLSLLAWAFKIALVKESFGLLWVIYSCRNSVHVKCIFYLHQFRLYFDMNGFFFFFFLFFLYIFPCLFLFYQVKATAENVDEAVRELPDANLVRYFFCFIFRLIINDAFVIALKDLRRSFTYQNNRLY